MLEQSFDEKSVKSRLVAAIRISFEDIGFARCWMPEKASSVKFAGLYASQKGFIAVGTRNIVT
jgi:hypothetical protein